MNELLVLDEEAVSDHAAGRMIERNIPARAVQAVMDHGRMVYTRGAVVFGLGRKEVRRLLREGIDLSSYEGVQVVCSHDDHVITVYRNRKFSRLKTGLGRGRHHGRRWR